MMTTQTPDTLTLTAELSRAKARLARSEQGCLPLAQDIARCRRQGIDCQDLQALWDASAARRAALVCQIRRLEAELAG